MSICCGSIPHYDLYDAPNETIHKGFYTVLYQVSQNMPL